jgi:hypothetical protein
LWAEWDAAVRVGRQRTEPPRLFHTIREAGVLREAPLLVETLCALAGGRVHIRGLDVYRGGERLAQGFCLTEEVEALLGAGGS